MKCDKLVYNISKHLVCSQCSNSLHLKCSRLNETDCLGYQQKTLHYTCQFCTDHECIKYEKRHKNCVLAVTSGSTKNVLV